MYIYVYLAITWPLLTSRLIIERIESGEIVSELEVMATSFTQSQELPRSCVRMV